MRIKNKNSIFGRYPSCDMLNNALRFLIEDKPELAFEEILYAISKANGYLHQDVSKYLKEHDMFKLYKP